LLLKTGPHLKKTQGIGIIATVINPNNEVAQANPSRETIFAVNRGKADDTVKRMKLVAARADAPRRGPYTSLL